MNELYEAAREALCNVSEPLYCAPETPGCLEGSKLVFGRGPVDAKVVFVGSNPGKSENKTGIPFTGVAGKQLETLCMMYDIPLDKIYVTNVIKLAMFNRYQPTDEDIIRHAPWLQSQLAIIQPRLVVAMGNVAAKTMLKFIPEGNLNMTSDEENDMQIKRNNGRVHDVGLGYTIVTTFNPIMYLESRYVAPLEKGFKAIRAEMNRNHITLANFFDTTVRSRKTGQQNMATKNAKTREEIEQDISCCKTDEEPAIIVQQIYDAIEIMQSDGTDVAFQIVETIAEGFGIPSGIVENIAILVASTNKRARPSSASSSSPPPPSKRRKPLDS